MNPLPSPEDLSPLSYWEFDLARVQQNARDLGEAFAGAEIYYALKANSHPAVIAALDPLVTGYEAASWGEIRQLLELGVSPARIIFGTAVKPPHQVADAVASGVTRFATDSAEELLMLAQHAPGCSVQIRARVDDSGSVFQLSGKFGAELPDLPDLALLALDLGLDVYGLSFNVGSQARQPGAHAAAVRAITPIFGHLQRHGCDLRRLNIGGGFPVEYSRDGSTVETVQEIGRAVHQEADALLPSVRLMLEPGRALAGPGIDLVTTVAASVARGDTTWLFCDAGVYNALMEAMDGQGGTRYPVDVLGAAQSEERQTYILAGPTGDSIDVIARGVELPKGITPGTRLRFRHAGAYTLCMASSFNGFELPPIRYLARHPDL